MDAAALQKLEVVSYFIDQKAIDCLIRVSRIKLKFLRYHALILSVTPALNIKRSRLFKIPVIDR